MGRSYTPKYRVDTVESNARGEVRDGDFAWVGKAPTNRKLYEWREAMNKSFEDGVNSHLRGTRIHSCKLIEQKTGRVVAEYQPIGIND